MIRKSPEGKASQLSTLLFAGDCSIHPAEIHNHILAVALSPHTEHFRGAPIWNSIKLHSTFPFPWEFRVHLSANPTTGGWGLPKSAVFDVHLTKHCAAEPGFSFCRKCNRTGAMLVLYKTSLWTHFYYSTTTPNYMHLAAVFRLVMSLDKNPKPSHIALLLFTHQKRS